MRGRIAPTAVLWLLVGAAYFLIPLARDVLLQPQGADHRQVLHARELREIFDDPSSGDRSSSRSSSRSRRSRRACAARADGLLGALEAAAAAARARLPRAHPVRRRRRSSSSSGCSTSTRARRSGSTREPYGFLVAAYVILAFPYIYFSLDAGFRSIDVHTLTEASQSLGASWRTTLCRVILPNIRAAALAGAFLTLAIVMGEFTIANLPRSTRSRSTSSTSTRRRPTRRRQCRSSSFGDHVGGDARAAVVGRGARPSSSDGAR